MTWNTWAIDGDEQTVVKHPASVARLQTFVAFEGGEGIVDPLDFRVMPLSVPGTAVRVAPGAGAVLNRAAGAHKQTYAIELTDIDEVQITPTDSGGGRSDLIVVRVENPFLAGQNFDLPANPEIGPYTYVRVIRGVPASTVNYHDLQPGMYGDVMVSDTDSAITLARIDLPASTGTVTQSYIKDLRQPIGFRRVSDQVIEQNPWLEVDKHLTDNNKLWATQDTFMRWPVEIDWNIPVPEWASAVECIVSIDAHMRDADTGVPTGVWGETVPVINGSSAGFTTTEFDWNWTGNPQIVPIRVLGTLPLPASLRGKTMNFRVMARMYANYGCRLDCDAGTYSTGQFHFKKNPSYT